MNLHNLSDSELLRKMLEANGYGDKELRRKCSKILAQRHGIIEGERFVNRQCKVLRANWVMGRSESWTEFDGSGYRRKRMTEVLSRAREQLWLDLGVPGILFKAEIAARTQRKRYRNGDEIILSGTFSQVYQDKPYFQRDGTVSCHLEKVRVNRKKTNTLIAQKVADELPLKMLSGYGRRPEKKRTFCDVMNHRRREKLPVDAALWLKINAGELHLVYVGDNAEKLDPRRREPREGFVETVNCANSRVQKTPSCWHLYTFAEGPPPKGDFMNPWSPQETVDGLAQRGDWVTSQYERRDREGGRMVDVSSLGLHVGMGASVWNFWIVDNARGWEMEARRYREMCLRYDLIFLDCHPRVKINLSSDRIDYYEGELLAASQTFSKTNVYQAKQKAVELWDGVIDEFEIEALVDWEWKRALKKLQEKLEASGLAGMIEHLREQEANA